MNSSLSARQAPSQPDWFASWFDSEHYHRLYAHRDQAEATGFIDALIESRHVIRRGSVLDLGCGTGRHSKYLASKGFDVTGLDLSGESLRQARLSEHARLRFVRQDMRLPFGNGRFDYVLNLFTSFGYFEDHADNLSVVHNIARALKGGGSVILDYLNVLYAETHLTAEEVVEREGTAYRLTRWSDGEHMFKRIAVDHGGLCGPFEHVERVAKLGLEDFRFMFSLCGLRLEAIYGDYRLRPFDAQISPRLILVAKKPAVPTAQLPSGEVLPDAADRFGGHAEIRSEHRLRNAERDRGIDPHELEVSLLGRRAQ
jgi:SAM-dependent methyltransferase